MFSGITNLMYDVYFQACGCSYLSTYQNYAHITDKGPGKRVTPEDLEFVLKKLDRYTHIEVEYAYHGYGVKAGNTPQHEEVLARIFQERTTPLQKLSLSQNCLSEEGMKKIITSINNNFANLQLQELLVTRDSLQGETVETLRGLKRAHPDLKIVLREYGTTRDPGTGTGYNEELT